MKKAVAWLCRTLSQALSAPTTGRVRLPRRHRRRAESAPSPLGAGLEQPEPPVNVPGTSECKRRSQSCTRSISGLLANFPGRPGPPLLSSTRTVAVERDYSQGPALKPDELLKLRDQAGFFQDTLSRVRLKVERAAAVFLVSAIIFFEDSV